MERAVLYERERDFEIKDAEVEKERELYRQRVGAPTTPTLPCVNKRLALRYHIDKIPLMGFSVSQLLFVCLFYFVPVLGGIVYYSNAC